MERQFKRFLKNPWGLEICLSTGGQGLKTIFRSKKSGVAGLLDFIKNCENVSRRDEKRSRDIVVFDKIVGQGAALLIVYLKNCENVSRRDEKRSRSWEVYGGLGSVLAADALERYGVDFYFQETVDKILNRDKTDLCPLEKISLSKKPEEFYKCLINRG